MQLLSQCLPTSSLTVQYPSFSFVQQTKKYCRWLLQLQIKRYAIVHLVKRPFSFPFCCLHITVGPFALRKFYLKISTERRLVTKHWRCLLCVCQDLINIIKMTEIALSQIGTIFSPNCFSIRRHGRAAAALSCTYMVNE